MPHNFLAGRHANSMALHSFRTAQLPAVIVQGSSGFEKRFARLTGSPQVDLEFTSYHGALGGDGHFYASSGSTTGVVKRTLDAATIVASTTVADFAGHVAVSAENDLVVVSARPIPANGELRELTAFDTTLSTQRWSLDQTQLGNSAFLTQSLVPFIRPSDGTIFAVTLSQNAQYVVVSSAGSVILNRFLGARLPDGTPRQCLAGDTAGNIYVSGASGLENTTDPIVNAAHALFSVSPAGAFRWGFSTFNGGTQSMNATGVAVSADGRVAANASLPGSGRGLQIFNAATGAHVPGATFATRIGSGTALARAFAFDRDGNVYIAGDRSSTWTGSGGAFASVWCLNTNYELVWARDTGRNESQIWVSPLPVRPIT